MAESTRAEIERALRTVDILREIAQERARQREKFAAQEAGLSREELLAILTEQFLEAARAVNDHEPWERLREELIQVAACAVKFVGLRDRAEGLHLTEVGS